MSKKMKYSLLLLITVSVLFFTAGPARSQTVVDFSDITYWVGTGANEAALVIDWNNGKTIESFAWGYRWDGAATGKDMLDAVTADDPRLEYAAHPLFPAAVYGIYYDFDGDGGGYVLTPPGVETGTANDTDDYYLEGWFGANWGYWLNSPTSPGDEPYNGGDWAISGVGMDNRNLFDGAWDAWSFDFDTTLVGVNDVTGVYYPGVLPVAAVPEPSSLLYLLCGLIGWLSRRRRA